MKKLILLELAFLFFATTFSSNPPPPGWYQQTLPVNDFVNDIFFLDSLNGWVATNGQPNINDTAYIMRTTNGGVNWEVQLTNLDSYNAIQFLDLNIGYIAAGWNVARVLKTTNGGANWFEATNFGLGYGMNDVDFLNKDTGWVSSSDFYFGGIWKTTTGGSSWIRQLAGSSSVQIKAINLLNKDTGWAVSSASQNNLYRTTNGGTNWNVQYTFSGQLNDVLFFNSTIGIVTGGINHRTSNGGFDWEASNDGGIKVSFGNDSVGWAGDNLISIQKTTNQGISWFSQITNVNNPTPFAITSQNAWAGGNKLIHTTDGGGLTDINNEENSIPEKFILYQNYPNPFNPTTNLEFGILKLGFVSLKIYDLLGKEVATIVNNKLNPGTYKYEFDGSNFTSGIYFYKIEITDEKSKNVFIDTKKMILTK